MQYVHKVLKTKQMRRYGIIVVCGWCLLFV